MKLQWVGFKNTSLQRFLGVVYVTLMQLSSSTIYNQPSHLRCPWNISLCQHITFCIHCWFSLVQSSGKNCPAKRSFRLCPRKLMKAWKGAPKWCRHPGLTWLRLTICFYCKSEKGQLYLSTSKPTANQTMTAQLAPSPGPFILSSTVISEPNLLKYLHAPRLHVKSIIGCGKFYKMVREKQGWPGWREDIKH